MTKKKVVTKKRVAKKKKKKGDSVKALKALIQHEQENYASLNQRHIDLHRKFFLGLMNGNVLQRAYHDQIKKTERFEKITDKLMEA